MLGILLTGHGHIASGIASSVTMIAGEQTDFEVLDFTDDIAHSYSDLLKEKILAFKDKDMDCLVICDLMGGTPFNQAMLLSQEIEGVEVVTGASLPVLLEILMGKEGANLDELAELAVEAGKVAVVHPKLELDSQESDDLDGGI